MPVETMINLNVEVALSWSKKFGRIELMTVSKVNHSTRNTLYIETISKPQNKEGQTTS